MYNDCIALDYTRESVLLHFHKIEKKKGRIFKNEKGKNSLKGLNFLLFFLLKSFRLGLGSYLLLVLG